MFYPLIEAGPIGAVSSVSGCHSGGREFVPRSGHITLVEIGHEIISMTILSLPLIQLEQL